MKLIDRMQVEELGQELCLCDTDLFEEWRYSSYTDR
jgi:hypothetical protein